MSNPLVTVIIPAFNRSGVVASAVSSVQAQTYTNWEIIVVDDGSTDGTCDVVKRLARDDSRIRLVREKCNRGAQVARNTGINAACGDWVAFLDSDDTWLAHSLESRLTLALDHQLAVVYSGWAIRQQDGAMTPYYAPPMVGWVYRALLLREGPAYPSLLVAREALRKIGGLDERIIAFQEWDTALSLAQHYEFGFVPNSTFVYNFGREDAISRNRLRGAIGYEQVFHKRYADILRFAGPGALAAHYRIAADWYEQANATRPARRCALMTLFWSSLDARSGLRRIRRLLSRAA